MKYNIFLFHRNLLGSHDALRAAFPGPASGPVHGDCKLVGARPGLGQARTNLSFPTRLSGLVPIFFPRHFRNLTRPYLICMNTVLAYILNSK
jgi:hypothetical protein